MRRGYRTDPEDPPARPLAGAQILRLPADPGPVLLCTREIDVNHDGAPVVPAGPKMPALPARQDDAPPGLAGAGGMAARMLAVSWDTVRLFLHVLAATIWVGGQLTLAALVPVLRIRDAGLPKIAARTFNRIAWPAFGVLVVTGVW